MAYYPLLVRVNGNINEEDAIATGERIITLEKAPVDSETDEVVKEPFAAVQTLYYGENKYGYSDDVKGRKGKLGPGDTYSDLELETLTLWWGQEKSESGMSLRFEDQFGITPKNQSCQILNYPFTTMPVTIHSWQLNKDTMSGWLDTLEGAGLNMVYTDSQGQQVKREDPGFRIINMLGAGDAADEDNMLRLMRGTALKSTSNGEGRIDVANALVSTGIALATTYNIGTDMDMLTMKIVPTADPTVFRGIFLAGINNMIDDNVTGIDPDTSQKDDLDYMCSGTAHPLGKKTFMRSLTPPAQTKGKGRAPAPMPTRSPSRAETTSCAWLAPTAPPSLPGPVSPKPWRRSPAPLSPRTSSCS